VVVVADSRSGNESLSPLGSDSLAMPPLLSVVVLLLLLLLGSPAVRLAALSLSTFICRPMISTNMLMRAFISFSLQGIPSLLGFRRPVPPTALGPAVLELVAAEAAAAAAGADEDDAAEFPPEFFFDDVGATFDAAALLLPLLDEVAAPEPLLLLLPLPPPPAVPNVIFTSRAPPNPPFPAIDLRYSAAWSGVMVLGACDPILTWIVRCGLGGGGGDGPTKGAAAVEDALPFVAAAGAEAADPPVLDPFCNLAGRLLLIVCALGFGRTNATGNKNPTTMGVSTRRLLNKRRTVRNAAAAGRLSVAAILLHYGK
jgi:hypothetical protein